MLSILFDQIKVSTFIFLTFSVSNSYAEPIPTTLKPNEGYWLAAVDSNSNIERVHLAGTKTFNLTGEIISYGIHYRLIVLPEGDYFFKLLLPNSDYKFPLKSSSMKFSIERGKINYAGHFKYRGSNYGRRAKIELVNRSSVALEHMHINHASLLDEYELRYNGVGEDDFLYQESLNLRNAK